MFIILSICSTNSKLLINFFKFFYKLKKNQVVNSKLPSTQSQRKENFFFFSTLQSPHINKKSEEQPTKIGGSKNYLLSIVDGHIIHYPTSLNLTYA
jgi:ribosomal protein S10